MRIYKLLEEIQAKVDENTSEAMSIAINLESKVLLSDILVELKTMN